MGRLPKAPFEKILKDSAKNIRVSDKAAASMTDVMEELAKELAADAAELALHANRKTILEQDVRLARKKKF